MDEFTNYDALEEACANLAYVGITFESCGKDQGWMIDIPCCYSGGTYMSIWVHSTACEFTNHSAGGLKITGTWQDAISCMETAAKNIFHRAMLGLSEAA
jgi:hypothetical protein